MNASRLLADIDAGRITEVTEAANSYYDEVRGLTVRQTFYVYPDGIVVALNYADGSYRTLTLSSDDAAIFSHLYLRAQAPSAGTQPLRGIDNPARLCSNGNSPHPGARAPIHLETTVNQSPEHRAAIDAPFIAAAVTKWLDIVLAHKSGNPDTSAVDEADEELERTLLKVGVIQPTDTVECLDADANGVIVVLASGAEFSVDATDGHINRC